MEASRLGRLRIKLLGGFTVLDDRTGGVALPARKAQALLAYLALSAGQWRGRDRLAGLLWSDRQEARARNSLRQALASIRHIGQELGVDLVEADGDRVRLPDGMIETDVAAFRELGDNDPLAATGLYAGDLLDGFTVPDAAFQAWLTAERAALRESACRIFDRAVTRAASNGDWRKAVELARRLIGLDPYRESSHRRLMELYVTAGDRAAAIRQYQDCERLLRNELDVAPAQQTMDLLERIRIGGAATPPGRAAPALHPPLPDRPSIAVLPFDNLSGEPDHSYFADGMAEDIIAGLSRFRWLFVIARNSSFIYKGRPVDVRHLARELGVRYVLEGSIRKRADRIRVTAQLIDATAGNPIWCGRYDRALEDLFALQDEITETLVGAITPEIDQAERQRAERHTPDSVDTWLMFQKGLTAYYETTEASLEAAVESLDEVCRRDRQFARAHAFAADARHRQSIHFDVQGKPNLLAAASELARKAMELDRRDSIGYSIYARVLAFQGDHGRAIRFAEQGIDLNPNDWMAHHALGYVLIVGGRFEAGLEALDKAQRLSPHSAFSAGVLSMRAGALIALGRFDEAATVAELGIEAAHPRPSTFLYLAAVHALLGHIDRARMVLHTLQERHPTYSMLALTPERINTGSLSWQAVGKPLVEGLRLCGAMQG
jgi:TolB-like protein/DNA-binding SARP family transcriptional activator